MGVLAGELEFARAVEKLLPHQRAFIGAGTPNAAYVGGVGSGKSVALMITAILCGFDDPNGLSLIGRLTMPSLATSTMRTFLELMPTGQGEWKESDKRFIANNGHQFLFRHLDMKDPKAVGHIKSMNLSCAFVDEATEISEDIYFLLLSRIRRQSAKRRFVRLASNPAGHDWVWRHFFDESRTPALLSSNLGITASTFDNVHLPKEYIDNMLATWPQDWQERYIHGHFSDFSDLIYKEFTERTHVWDSSRSHDCFDGGRMPPLDWPVVVGIDIGSDVEHDPWAIALIAVAPDGSLFQFDEIYRRGILISEIAEEYHSKMYGRSNVAMAYDYSNRQCALELAEHGINGQAAIKEIKPGLQKVGQYMHIDKRLTHPFLGVEGAPRFFVASHCKSTIRELTGYKYAKDRSGNSMEEPAHENSHSPDAIRYAIHTYRPLPERMPLTPLWHRPSLDTLSRMYWQDQARHEEVIAKRDSQWAKPRAIRFQRPYRIGAQRAFTRG